MYIVLWVLAWRTSINVNWWIKKGHGWWYFQFPSFPWCWSWIEQCICQLLGDPYLMILPSYSNSRKEAQLQNCIILLFCIDRWCIGHWIVFDTALFSTEISWKPAESFYKVCTCVLSFRCFAVVVIDCIFPCLIVSTFIVNILQSLIISLDLTEP